MDGDLCIGVLTNLLLLCLELWSFCFVGLVRTWVLGTLDTSLIFNIGEEVWMVFCVSKCMYLNSLLLPRSVGHIIEELLP